MCLTVVDAGRPLSGHYCMLKDLHKIGVVYQHAVLWLLSPEASAGIHVMMTGGSQGAVALSWKVARRAGRHQALVRACECRRRGGNSGRAGSRCPGRRRPVRLQKGAPLLHKLPAQPHDAELLGNIEY